MVIRNYAITPRRGIEQSAQDIAMGNRRCRLRPIIAKTALGILCPSRANVTLPSTQGDALGWAFVDLSGFFFRSMRTIHLLFVRWFFPHLALHHPFQYLLLFCRDKSLILSSGGRAFVSAKISSRWSFDEIPTTI